MQNQTTTIKPVNDRIAVIREKPKEMYGTRIHIPDTVQEKPQRCEVIAVGPGRILDSGEFKPLTTKVGDIVLLNGRWAGFEAEIILNGEDTKVIFVKEDEILAVVEDVAPKKKGK